MVVFGVLSLAYIIATSIRVMGFRAGALVFEQPVMAAIEYVRGAARLSSAPGGTART